MNADVILSRIQEDALKTAAQIGEEAKAKADALKAASEEKIAALKEETLRKAEEESGRMADRMKRMSELDTKKFLLQNKQMILEELFRQAGDTLSQLPREETRAFFLKKAVLAAEGDESVAVGGLHGEWFDAAFTGELNKALEAAGKPGKITDSGEQVPGCTGLVLRKGGTEVYCTFESLIDEARPAMEAEIARKLFES